MRENVDEMFKRRWEDDETLNEGDIDGSDYGEDEIYND
jgi:hypothetical protein